MHIKMRFKPEDNHSRSTGGGDWLPVPDCNAVRWYVSKEMLFQKMTGRRSLCGFEACGWSLKHESFEACGKVKGNTEKQCDHDYIPPSKNVHGSVSMQSHKEKSLGQSPRSILERWNSSQSQSLPAPASAATVLDKKGNKSKQVRRSSTKVKNAKQAKVESAMK